MGVIFIGSGASGLVIYDRTVRMISFLGRHLGGGGWRIMQIIILMPLLVRPKSYIMVHFHG